MNESPKDPISEYIKREMENEAAQGKRFPVDYIGDLANKYNETVVEMLKANKAPQEVIDAIDTAVMLERVHNGLRTGDISDWDARWIYQEHINILNSLVAMGGDFSGIARDPVMWNAVAETPVKS
jgi:hypothetical protein